MSILCVWGGGRGRVIILLAGYLPDVYSVCVGGGSSFCLLVTYLMSILCVCGGGGGHHSACWLPT